MKKVTITNSFHHTSYEFRGEVGARVSASSIRRIRKALCGVDGCTCGRTDGSRESRYRIEPEYGHHLQLVSGVIVDTRENAK